MNVFRIVLLFSVLISFPIYSGGSEDEILEALKKLSIGSQRSVHGEDSLPRYVLVILSRDIYDGPDVESDGESDEEFSDDFLGQSENLYTANQFGNGGYLIYDRPASLEEVPAGPAPRNFKAAFSI